jgi:hypothetical protein
VLSLWISGRRDGIWSRVLYVVHCIAAQCHASAYRNTRFMTHLGCGDIADIINHSGKTAAESDCAMPCSGDPQHLCGGTFRLQLYLWNGNLNTWHVPANIGRYEVFTCSFPNEHGLGVLRVINVVPPGWSCTTPCCYCRYQRQGIFPREGKGFWVYRI